jgi:hypothetical protein
MGKKQNKVSRKKPFVHQPAYGKFYVVDIDHMDDASMTHPIDIKSLRSIYPGLGKTLESIYHIGDRRSTPYPPIGRKGILQGRKKLGNIKRTSIYPPLQTRGVIEVKLAGTGSFGTKKQAFLSPAEDMLDKITELTGKTISSPLREKIVGSVYPPIGIALVEKGNIVKIIKNNGRK